jgi:predicted nucleic acid-binding protein
MRAYFDTAVVVAAVVAGHPHYNQAEPALDAAQTKKIQAHISAHGVAECFSVLTKTPFTPRVSPSEAWHLLAENVLPYFEIVGLSAKDYRDTVEQCSRNGWSGGRIYDVLHLRSARKATCERIFTFNVRHFQQLAPDLSDRIAAP